MASDCAALGVFSRMLVQGGAAPRTFNSSSERYPFVREGIQSSRAIQGKRRIVGTRDLYSAAMRPHSYVIAGEIAFQPGPAELTAWLPRILGGTGVAGAFPVADDLPSFDMLIDRENDVFLYTNCRVARALFTSSTNLGSEEEELVEMVLTIVAETEVNGQAWPSPQPSIPNTAAYAPYGNWEGTLTLGGFTRLFDAFNLLIDNDIFMRARSSLTPNCIRAGDRTVRLMTRNPFTSVTHSQALTLWSTGASGSLKFINGNMSTEFTFPHLRNTYSTPNVGSKNEVPLALALQAARTGDLANQQMIYVTHDDTP